MKTTLKQFDDFIDTFMGRLEIMGLRNNIIVSFQMGIHERTVNTAGDMPERMFPIQVPAEHPGKTRREGDSILMSLAKHEAHKVLFRDVSSKAMERFVSKQDMSDALRNAVKALDAYVSRLESVARLRPVMDSMDSRENEEAA